MRRLLATAAALAALALSPACDSGERAERPSFRAEITGDVEAVLTGRPRVTVGPFEPGDLYTFVLQSGPSSVGLSVEGRPRPGTYSALGAGVALFDEDPVFFLAQDGEITVEAVEDDLVRASFAFRAAEGFDGSGRQVRVEGTMTASLDDRLPTPPLP